LFIVLSCNIKRLYFFKLNYLSHGHVYF
jgi:hypothetical protein